MQAVYCAFCQWKLHLITKWQQRHIRHGHLQQEKKNSKIASTLSD